MRLEPVVKRTGVFPPCSFADFSQGAAACGPPSVVHLQQPANMCEMRVHAKRHTDHLGHPRRGPHLAAEALSLGATAPPVGQTGQRLRSQPAGLRRACGQEVQRRRWTVDRAGDKTGTRIFVLQSPNLIYTAPQREDSCGFQPEDGLPEGHPSWVRHTTSRFSCPLTAP
jgi:hypothetical protein